MTTYDYDLFVIGAGSGGVRAARIAASLGARVAICEDRKLGGTCVNLGCVPKKLMMYGSRYPSHAQDAAGFGWEMPPPTLRWSQLMHNKNREIRRLNGVYQRLLDNAGATLIRGRGALLDEHTVTVDGARYTAHYILICTGGRPFVPPVPGAELGITSDGVFFLDALPRRTMIIGGGYIGVEFASILAGYGSEVTLVHRNPLLLNDSFDDDITLFLTDELTRQGIEVCLSSTATALQETAGGIAVSLDDGSTMEVDRVLWAAGRRPNTAELGLEAVGIQVDPSGAIPVNDTLQTLVPNIYACGDVINRVPLTPVALAEGMLIARNLFTDSSDRTMDYTLIPTTVFARPHVGTVGMTEAEARRGGIDVAIYKSDFREMKHTLTGRQERTMMKLVVCKETDKVLGCHMVGENAGEIIQGLAVALKAGATKAIFDATVGIHPTAAEEFVTMRTRS